MYNEYGYSAIEAFVEFNEDLLIAQEGAIKYKASKMVESLVLTITQIAERLNRFILTVKRKMNKSKRIGVPTKFLGPMAQTLRETSSLIETHPEHLDDITVKRVEDRWKLVKSEFSRREQLKEYEEIAKTGKGLAVMSPVDIYNAMINTSKNISETLKQIKQWIKDSTEYSYLHGLKNRVRAYRIQMDLYSVVLSFYTVKTDNPIDPEEE